MQQDLQRQCIELALASGKKYCHSDTRFITLQNPSLEGFIPLYENFLYALALLRSKTQENILETRALLERLFYFQHPDALGNFPLFIHEFPHARDHMQAVRILAVLVWIQRDFTTVLGASCGVKLKTAMSALVSFVQRHIHDEPREHPLPIWARCKIACVLDACGVDVPCPDLTCQTELKTYGDPVMLGEMISAYHLSPKKADWSSFWRYLASCWHDPSKSYVGPAFKVVCDGFGAEVSPFDYYMGSLFGGLGKKADAPQLAALSCALIPQNQGHLREDQSLLLPLPRPLAGHNTRFAWNLLQTPLWAVATLSGEVQPEQSYGFFPLRLVTPKHTLALQMHHAKVTEITYDEHCLQVIVDVHESAFYEDKEKSKVLSLYFDDTPDSSVMVSGQMATCFTIDEPVTICLGDVSLQVCFEAEGQYVGHIARGNRHGQKRTTPSTQSFDTHVFVRALRATNAFRFTMSIKILENNLQKNFPKVRYIHVNP